MPSYSKMSRETERLILKSAASLGIFAKVCILIFVYQSKFKTPIYTLEKTNILSRHQIKSTARILVESGMMNHVKAKYNMHNEQKNNCDILFLALNNFAKYAEIKEPNKPKEWLEA